MSRAQEIQKMYELMKQQHKLRQLKLTIAWVALRATHVGNC